jgi:protein-S-isoprenylcysteine O-methyltransferase Ste14
MSFYAASRVVEYAWLAFGAYMLLAAFTVRRAERRESLASSLSYQILTIGGAVLLLFDGFGPNWLGQRVVPVQSASIGASVLLTLAGIGLAAWARYCLGRNWSGHVTIKVGHELVRSGPYAWFRHPMYVGLEAAILGTALLKGEWKDLLGVALIALGLWRKSRIENAFLASRFGADTS